jgi:serine protease
VNRGAPKARRAAHWLGVALAAAVNLPAFAQSGEAATAQLIVKFRDGGERAALAPGARVSLLANESGVLLVHRRAMAQGAQVVQLLRALPMAQARALAARIASNADVEFAEADGVRRPTMVPNDTLSVSQIYLDASIGGVNAYGAWDLTQGSAAITVAVVDTGITNHVDLTGRVLPGYDFIGDPVIANDGDGRDADPTDPGDWVTAADLANPAFSGQGCEVRDSSWHGTSVAGVAAANGNNGIGVAGMDWHARVLPVRVLGKCVGHDSDILDGVAWAAGLPVPGVPANPNPAQVINLSLGGPDPCLQAYHIGFQQALAHGVTRAIIVAAGNESVDVATTTPAGCSEAIAIAATTYPGSLTSYSNFGAGVALSAPGGDGGRKDAVVTLWNLGTTVQGADSYAYVEGTSFSAPIVSGVVSLMLSVAPNLTAAQVRALLQSSAKPFPAGSTCTTARCGAGIVDARAAVAAAQAAAGGASGINYQGLWWRAGGSESGWGINFAHQGNQIFATWYTFDATGNAWWLTMLATRTTGENFDGVIYTTNGPPFNNYTAQTAFIPRAVGNGTLSFSNASSGSFTYTVNSITQTKPLARYDLGTGPVPVCTYSAVTPDFFGATNYQDLWWVANGVESGWGINFAHQGNSIFATWYTYDGSNAPVWLTVLATLSSGIYSGTLYRSSGPTYSAYDASKWSAMPVGTATFAFADGNHATFGYTTSGQGGLPASNQSKQITRFPFAAAGGTLCH